MISRETNFQARVFSDSCLKSMTLFCLPKTIIRFLTFQTTILVLDSLLKGYNYTVTNRVKNGNVLLAYNVNDMS